MIPTKPLNLSIYAACGVDTLGSSDHVSDGGPDLLREGARLRGTYPGSRYTQSDSQGGSTRGDAPACHNYRGNLLGGPPGC